MLFASLVGAGYSAACHDGSVEQPPATADGGSGTACIPGASVACVGQGGCSGGQVCSANGASLGPCVCGPTSGDGGQPGADASPADSGDSGASVSTTLGALHVTWVLKGATSGSTLTCAQVTGQSGVSVTLTPSGGASPISMTFPCVGNSGDLVAVPVGTYTAVADILNGSSQSLGSAAPVSVTVASSPCDGVVSNECVRNSSETILVDGR